MGQQRWVFSAAPKVRITRFQNSKTGSWRSAIEFQFFDERLLSPSIPGFLPDNGLTRDIEQWFERHFGHPVRLGDGGKGSLRTRGSLRLACMLCVGWGLLGILNTGTTRLFPTASISATAAHAPLLFWALLIILWWHRVIPSRQSTLQMVPGQVVLVTLRMLLVGCAGTLILWQGAQSRAAAQMSGTVVEWRSMPTVSHAKHCNVSLSAIDPQTNQSIGCCADGFNYHPGDLLVAHRLTNMLGSTEFFDRIEPATH